MAIDEKVAVKWTLLELQQKHRLQVTELAGMVAGTPCVCLHVAEADRPCLSCRCREYGRDITEVLLSPLRGGG